MFPPLPLNWLKKILPLILKNYYYLTKESRIIHNSLHFCIDEVTVLSQGWHNLHMIFMKLKKHYCKINSLVSCPPVEISVSLSLSPYLPSFCFCYLALRVMPVFFPHKFPSFKACWAVANTGWWSLGLERQSRIQLCIFWSPEKTTYAHHNFWLLCMLSKQKYNYWMFWCWRQVRGRGALCLL